MSAMDEFKKVLEAINKKRVEIDKYDTELEEIHKKTRPLYDQLEILYEQKRLAERNFLEEIEAEISN